MNRQIAVGCALLGLMFAIAGAIYLSWPAPRVEIPVEREKSLQPPSVQPGAECLLHALPARVWPIFPARLRDATVRVRLDRNGRGAVAGTGVVLQPYKELAPVLTAGHIFAHPGVAKVVFPHGTVLAQVLATQMGDMDLALLAIPATLDMAYAVVADKPSPPLAAVWSLGYSDLRKNPPEARVRVGNIDKHWYGSMWHYTFIPQAGDAGAGIFRQDDHKLIGVVSTGIIDLCGATGREGIWKFLQDPKISKVFPHLPGGQKW